VERAPPFGSHLLELCRGGLHRLGGAVLDVVAKA
jgi:hypothetical protein